MQELLEEIEQILLGIDQTEVESEQGWWETSTGVEFGFSKLQAIRDAFARKAADSREG